MSTDNRLETLEVSIPVTRVGETVHVRLSKTLRDVLVGDHSFTGMDHRQRVEYLFGLQTLYAAVLKVGWVEHTNDWDWSVQVTTDDGKVYGATYDEPYVNCDTFRLAAELNKYAEIPYDSEDPTTARIKQLELEIELVDAGGAYQRVDVDIDKLTTLHIEED